MSTVQQWPKVSVVIPARDAEETIGDTLEGVLSQDYPGVVEVIVGDGSGSDATSSLIRSNYPTVKVVKNADRITSSGLNRAIESSSGNVVVRCDAHAVLPPGYIRRSVETMRRTGAAVVGGLQSPTGDTLFRRAVGTAMTTPLGAGDSRYKIGGHEGPTDTVYLGVFRAEALSEIGGFDETIVHNQDYELNWRLRDRGETVWLDPELVVSYRPRHSLRTLARQYFNYGRWKSVVLMHHPRSLRWRQLAPPALMCALAVSLGCAVAGLWQLAIVMPTLYLAALLLGSIAVGLRRPDRSAILLPLVLATMHLSWGLGFFVPGRRIVTLQNIGSPRDRVSPGDVHGPSYHYLLFVGPGRSATTYVYRILRDYYSVSFPDIKESYYYRNPRRYRRARGRIPQDHLLADIANDAYMDSALPMALRRLKSEGVRVLVVVILRDHIDRARSMLQFDINRGRALRPGGRTGLEGRVMGRRLTPDHLRNIYSTGTNVAVLDFDLLTARPDAILNRLASECGIDPTDAALPRVGSNASERARFLPATAAAALLAKTMRRAGLLRALQRLKDSRRIHWLFFEPLRNLDDDVQALSTEHMGILRDENSQCWRLLRQHSTVALEGFYLMEPFESEGRRSLDRQHYE